MRKMKFCIVATVATMTLPLASCHFGHTGGGADGDSLLYSTITFEDSANANGGVAYQQIYVAYPAADVATPLADSIRSWMNGELKTCCYPQMGDFGVSEVEPYTGDLRDGEALVRHYGSQGTAIMGKIMADGDEDGWIPMGYGNDYHASVLAQTENYLTYTTGYSIYTGGAHGLYMCEQITFDRADGRRLGWELVDTLEARAELMKCLREGIEEYFNTDVDEDYSNPDENTVKVTLRDVLFAADFNPELSDDELLSLPGTQPALTPEGVSFIYQQYEIVAYAYGLPSCTIPYEKAKAFLTPVGKKLAGVKD